MKKEIRLAEVFDLINEIKQQPNSLFEMISLKGQEAVGRYLSSLMDTELTQFPGREKYESGTEDEQLFRCLVHVDLNMVRAGIV